MFIEINNVKKHYGEGDSRVDVLKGIDVGHGVQHVQSLFLE